MKKIILTALIAASCVFSAAAFSWSGVVDDNTKFTANHDFSQPVLEQSNGIFLSASSSLAEAGNLRFAAEGMYRYVLTCDLKNSETNFKNIADLDLLKIAGEFSVGKGQLAFSAGRFQYSDYSATLFSQISDGLYLNYNTLKTKVSLYAGYTGLLNRLNVSMLENEYDANDNFYAFCPKYVPVVADFAYKALFDTNTIGLQGAAFIPVTDKNTLKTYGTFILNGALGRIGSYDAKVTAGTEKFETCMLDAKLDLNFFLGQMAMASVGGEYISGAQGELKPFVTISSRSFGNIPGFAGGILPKISVLFANDKLYASLTEKFVINMPENEAKFDGFDTVASVTYKLFSDVKLGFDAGAYICTETKELSNYFAAIKASLAF